MKGPFDVDIKVQAPQLMAHSNIEIGKANTPNVPDLFQTNS